jgi:hypothetical protein
MATYKISYESDIYPAEANTSIHVRDDLVRQYATIVNSAVAKVLAYADVLLILAEDGKLDPESFMAKGLDIKVEQG